MQLSSGNRRCGVVYFESRSEVYLPLEHADVHVDVVDVSAIVTVSQHFWQYNPQGLSQAKYVFPIPARAAVCGFEMASEGTVITAVAKEKEEARQEHTAAIRQGYMTGLVEHVTDDIFVMSLGALPGRQLVTTRLTYVLDLADDDTVDRIRVQLPVYIGYRFGTLPKGMKAARKTAPHRVKISVDVRMQGVLRNISSPTHPTVVISSNQTTRSSQDAQYSSPRFLEQDFVLLITADGLDAPRCFAQRGADGTVALQLNVIPKFDIPSVPQQEYIFLVDRSASMTGSRITMAKRSLVMLLRALPSEGTWFNIFSFGNYCDGLWTRSVPYDEGSLRRATSHIDAMDADYGGTNIEDAVDKTLRSRKLDMPTAVFVLTDGESYEIDRAISFVNAAITRAKDHPVRVFTLGIGNSASSAMCEGLARAGNGFCLMATESESILGKCSRLVRASRSVIYNEVSVDWGVRGAILDSLWTASSDSKVVSQVPSTLPILHPGSRFIVFAWIQDEKYIPPTAVVIWARPASGGESLRLSVPVRVVEYSPERHPRPLVHTLMARRAIMELEDSEKTHHWSANRSAIIHLGTRYQLVSSCTSFVAVDKRTESELPELQPPPYEAYSHSKDYSYQPAGDQEFFSRPPVERSLKMSLPHGAPAQAVEQRRRSFQLPSMGSLFRSSSSSQPNRATSTSRAVLPMSEVASRSAVAPSIPPSHSSGFLSRVFRKSTAPSPTSNPARTTVRSPSPSSQPPYYAPIRPPAMAVVESMNHYDPTVEGWDDPSLLRQEEYGAPPPRMDRGHRGLTLATVAPTSFAPTPFAPTPFAPTAFAPTAQSSTQGVDEKVVALVRLQAFDGGFPGTNELFNLLGGGRLMTEAKKLGVAEGIWATVLAVTYLQLHLKDQRDLLDGLVQKAMVFLSITPNLKIEALLLRAQQMLSQ